MLALLQNRDPGRVDALLDALPLETRELLETLSPARHLGRAEPGSSSSTAGRTPRSRSRRACGSAAAAPDRSRLVLVGLIGHVEGQAPAWHRLADLMRLWSVCYELLAG